MTLPRTILMANILAKGKPLAHYLPDRLEKKKMHHDPEFETFTYGEPAFNYEDNKVPQKARMLKRLDEGDLLVFYAGLSPWQFQGEDALYIIGYFTIEKVIDLNNLDDDLAGKELEKWKDRCKNNAHLKRDPPDENVVMAIGSPECSRLLGRAVPISKPAVDSRGHRIYLVSNEMEAQLGIRGNITRCLYYKFIYGQYYLDNLKSLLGNG